jgi:competence protein ComEC
MFYKINLFIKKYFKIIFVIFLSILVFFVWSTAFYLKNQNLVVSFLDIGQGDSIFIKSPTGNKIIFDGGPGDLILRQLPKKMTFFDRSIDMIVVTNPDKDHFEGFIPLLDSYEVSAFLDPGVLASSNPIYRELIKKVDEKKIAKIKAVRGQKIDIGGGAYIEIIFPDRENILGVSHNDGSIVARLIYGKTSVLLTGDSTANIEKYLLENYPESLNADILKVAHHGSRTSTSDDFVKVVSPKVAIISAGKDNSYGHPHKETLDTLEKNKVPILGTYSEGTITFESDGESIWRD